MSPKHIANLAELAAAALRHLAGSLDAASAHPGESTERTLAEDRRQARGALERLAEVLGARAGGRAARRQADDVATAAVLLSLRAWADSWDALALAVDP